MPKCNHGLQNHCPHCWTELCAKQNEIKEELINDTGTPMPVIDFRLIRPLESADASKKSAYEGRDSMCEGFQKKCPAFRGHKNIKLFVNFLRDNDIYHDYIYNYDPEFVAEGDEIKGLPPTCLLGQGFIWKDSPEGDEFWRDLDGKWDEYLETNNAV